MKKKKCIAAGALAAFLLCESLFTPNLAGMGAGLLQVQAAAANVALNKEVTSSANETTALSADKAVDGDKESDEGRWSSGDMGNNRDNPQWLVIDLAAQKTDVESISVYFNKKAWSTEYQIQTSDSNASDAQWETVYEMSRASADVQRNDPDVIQASALNSSALKRYVRFYFKKGNINGWKCISVREIEIMGTQSGRIETAAGVLKNIPAAMTVESGEDQLSLPSDSENYDISIHGSEADQILGTAGQASSESVFIEMINKVFTHHLGVPFVGGIFLCGILAAIMSTADSQLLVCASSVSKDIYKNVMRPEAEEQKVLKVSRITVVVIAVIAFFIAWNPESSIMNLVSDAWAGLGSAFGPIVVCSLFWKRTNFAGAVAGMVSGGLTVLIWDYIPLVGGQTIAAATGIYSLLVGFFISLVCIVVASLCTKAPSEEILVEFNKVSSENFE